MPIYVYCCDNCGEMELWRAINDEELTGCPTCANRLERLFCPKIAVLIPAHMQAVAGEYSERQAAYIKSDKFYNECKKIEAKGGSVKVGSDCSND
jgi:putative FmdB family regulatory protein